LNEAAEKNKTRTDKANEEEEEAEEEESPENAEFNLDGKHRELLNVISNYVDFYDPGVDVKSDTRTKFTYAVHALNHALK
jgi:hypothetical protein